MDKVAQTKDIRIGAVMLMETGTIIAIASLLVAFGGFVVVLIFNLKGSKKGRYGGGSRGRRAESRYKTYPLDGGRACV